MDILIMQKKLDRLEKRYNKLRFTFISVILIAIIILVFLSFQQPGVKKDDILELKGLIIKDEQGRPRIMIGAPLKNIKGRNRHDELYGIAYLDENGNDRITVGKNPDPMTPKGILSRRVQGAGILIHDKDGVERGGYSVLDDDMAILTLDWPKSGEAIALSAGHSFSAVGLFHKSAIGKYREAITLGVLPKQSQSFFRVSDSAYNQRWLMTQENLKDPEIRQYDKNGKEISGK